MPIIGLLRAAQNLINLIEICLLYTNPLLGILTAKCHMVGIPQCEKKYTEFLKIEQWIIKFKHARARRI
jgi:hypothetical protein